MLTYFDSGKLASFARIFPSIFWNIFETGCCGPSTRHARLCVSVSIDTAVTISSSVTFGLTARMNACWYRSFSVNSWSCPSACCALGTAYVGRPETDQVRGMAMSMLGNGLQLSKQHEDALSVYKAELSMRRRVGSSEYNILVVQGNLAHNYAKLGRLDEALLLKRDVYSATLKLHGEEREDTLREADNYASSLNSMNRFEEAKALLRKMMPVARRVLGENDETTIRMRWTCGQVLYLDPSATLDDLHEAATTLEDTASTARRVLGGPHPLTVKIGRDLQDARATLAAREVDFESFRDAFEAMMA